MSNLNICDEYDLERALWCPGRRSFLFMLGAAAVGSMVPPAKDWEYYSSRINLTCRINESVSPGIWEYDGGSRLWLAT